MTNTPIRPPLKIVAIDDCEWWLGANVQEAILAAAENYNMTPKEAQEHYIDARLLTQKELDDLEFFPEGDRSHEANTLSFRDQLAKEMVKDPVTPRFFATTEF